MAVEEVERIEPDPSRDRRACRQRQDNPAQHQSQNGAEQRPVDRPPPVGQRIAFFTGEHLTSLWPAHESENCGTRFSGEIMRDEKAKAIGRRWWLSKG